MDQLTWNRIDLEDTAAMISPGILDKVSSMPAGQV
jgi:hypothetical protein